ncbi:MAG: hypothetical protein ACR2JE_10685, partial [Acidobacteriaceae bacterium]
MRSSAMSRPLLLLLAGCLLSAATHAQSPQASPTSPTPQTSMMLSAPATTPEALTQRLVGKTVFLRGFYQGDHLDFDTNGKLAGRAAPGSFALSGLEITKVRFTKHSMQMEANRIGLHFFGGLPYEDDSKPYERIAVSKKPVEIEIERLVIEPEKKKKKKKGSDVAKVTQGEGIATPDEATAESDEPAVSSVPSNDVTAVPASAMPSPAAPSAGGKDASSAITGTGASQVAINHDPRQSYIQLSTAVEKIFA